MALQLNSKKFKSYKDKASQRAMKSSGFNDDRFITFEPNKKYKFRLLWDSDERSETDPDYRDSPFVETYTHSAKDETGRRHTITCPTTFDPTSVGFKACKCCETASRLYKSGQNGSQKDADLYTLYKRKFHGYALVYVVSDPTNPDNNGKVKLMHYSIRAKKFLDSEIFGIESNWGNDDDTDTDETSGDEVGEGAFALEGGFDLIVTVKKNGQWNDYNFKFARNATDIDADEEELNNQIKALNFDGLRKRTPAIEIENFYSDVILGNDAQSAMIDTVDTVETDEHSTTESEISELFSEDEETETAVETSTEVESDTDDDEEFDVEAFLNEVE
jgi:hypothetical protein